MAAKKKKPRLSAKRAANKARTLKRDAEVLAMCGERRTLDEIAKALGFAGRQGAQKARDRQLGKLAEVALDLAKEERDRQLEQTARELAVLDGAEAALLDPPRDEYGEARFLSVLDGVRVDDYARLVLARVRLLTLRAKLTGAMAPTVIDIPNLPAPAKIEIVMAEPQPEPAPEAT